MRLNTAVTTLAVGSNVCPVVLEESLELLFPAQRQIAGGHNLDKVHDYTVVSGWMVDLGQ